MSKYVGKMKPPFGTVVGPDPYGILAFKLKKT